MYGDLSKPSGQENTRCYLKENIGEQQCCEYKYTTVFSTNFDYKHIIDNHEKVRPPLV